MGLFRRSETPPEQRERLSQTLPSSCIGESCVNFSGVACQAYEELLQADGESGGVDLPPFVDEASYALYGRVCTGGAKECLVTERARILKPGVSPMQLIAQGGSFGDDLPLTIEMLTE